MAKHKRDKRAARVTGPVEPMLVRDRAFEDAQADTPLNPWTLPALPPGVGPPNKRAGGQTIAMDAAPAGAAAVMDWAAASRFHEGIGFLGYAYLAELSQRPEYRRVSEIIASEATRKWIKLRGEDKERVTLIEKALDRFKIRERFRELVELDGFFGRGHLYIDVGVRPGDNELEKELIVAKEKIGVGSVVNFKVIEPLWSYPGSYNTTSPLAADFYQPQAWYVMSDTVHASRLLTIVGRELPDMLKPTYAFGGLSLSQMLKPYVDNWLRTRQSVSDLVHSFSTMVLETDMGTALTGGASQTIVNRAKLFNLMRDNRGLMVIGKDKEVLTNITTPLGTLDKLLAQSQEQMASVAGIPLVVLLGVTPAGLNASSDGEMRAHYANIKAYQERTCAEPLKTIIDILQLDLDGKIDETISFEFLGLWEPDEKDKALVRKSDADADVALVGAGIVSNEEARDRMNQDEEGSYFGIDLSGPPPEAPDDEEELGALNGANDDEKRRKQANDAAPRSLYVYREVLNRDEIAEWAQAAGIPEIRTDLHVTVARTLDPVNWIKLDEDFSNDSCGALTIRAGGPRVVEKLGDRIALQFASNDLQYRHMSMRSRGVAWDFEEFIPHISLTKAEIDTDDIPPYRGEIILGPEIFTEVRIPSAPAG